MSEFRDVIVHYDALIDENNDPVLDPEPLKSYMDKWDGKEFIEDLQLTPSASVLEIGVGTGRLAIRTAPLCKRFVGIDISPKTINRATINLAVYSNIELICDDFITHRFYSTFEIIYSSLTFLHFQDKKNVIKKVTSLLNSGGRFAVSLDKNQSEFIEYGNRRLKIFPDKPEQILMLLENEGHTILKHYETEFAHIIVSRKMAK